MSEQLEAIEMLKLEILNLNKKKDECELNYNDFIKKIMELSGAIVLMKKEREKLEITFKKKRIN